MARSRDREQSKEQQNIPPSMSNSVQTMSCCRVLVFVIACIVAGLAILTAVPGPIDSIVINLHPFNEHEQFNNAHLKSAVKLFQGEFIGPEGFAVDSEGNMYTGLTDGRIVMFNDSSYTTVVRMGEPPYDDCGKPSMEDKCGRPLGLEIDPSNSNLLYIAESYHGIYRYNLHTKELKLVVNSSRKLDCNSSSKMMFINDLVVMKNGSIFFTDSSSQFARRELVKEVYECRPTGKLLHYNPVDDSLTQVMSGFTFANGLYMSNGEDFLLISETTACRITKYHLTGPKAGTVEPFIKGLPGLPDNISPSASGGLWVGFGGSRRSGMYDIMTQLPWIRNTIIKLHLGNFFMDSIPKDGLIVEYTEEGELVRGLYDVGADTIFGVSEVLDKGNKLYLGSFNAPYLARVDVP